MWDLYQGYMIGNWFGKNVRADGPILVLKSFGKIMIPP